jgi:hypothetical protein
MKLLFPLATLFLVSCTTNNEKKITEPNQNKADIASVYYPANKSSLENTAQALSLEYIVWGCACANWITKEDYKKYQDTGSLSAHCIFIEPADSILQIPDTTDFRLYNLKLMGKFYTQKGYPKNYIKTEEDVEAAKVFRYTNYKLVTKK